MKKIGLFSLFLFLSLIFASCSEISDSETSSDKEGLYVSTEFSARASALPLGLPASVDYGAIISCKSVKTGVVRYLVTKGMTEMTDYAFMISNFSISTEPSKLRFIYDSSLLTDPEYECTMNLYAFNPSDKSLYGYDYTKALAMGKKEFKLYKNQAFLDVGSVNIYPFSEYGIMGYGVVDLWFTWASDSLLGKATEVKAKFYKLDDSGNRDSVDVRFESPVLVGDPGEGVKYALRIRSSGSGVSSGIYEVDLDFGTTAAGLPLTTKSIHKTHRFSVFQGLTTECWYDSDGSPILDEDGSPAALTIEYALQKEYYVRGEDSAWFENAGSQDASDVNSGSISQPFASIQKAVDVCLASCGDELTEFTVYVDGKFVDHTTKSYEDDDKVAFVDIEPTKDCVINITGLRSDNYAVLNADRAAGKTGRVMNFNALASDVSLQLKNLKITGGYLDSESGAGISAVSGCLFLNGIEVCDNVSEQEAAGIYISDYAEISVSCKNVIKNNISTKTGSPLPSNLYLGTLTSNQIMLTVDGDISGSEIWVTTRKEPGLSNDIGFAIFTEDLFDTEEILEMFHSDEYYEIQKYYGLYLRVGGGSFTIPSKVYDDIKISTNRSPSIEKEVPNDYYKKITVQVRDSKLNKNLNSDNMSFSASLMYHGDVYKTFSTQELTGLDIYPNGIYQLVVSVVYKNNLYSATFDIDIVDYLKVEDLTTAPTSGYYAVDSYDGLAKIAEWCNSGSNPRGTYILLEDIELSDDFASIGNSIANKFTGTLDGNGNTITNLKVPLMKYSTGTIKNLTVKGEVTGNSAFIDNYSSGTYVTGSASIENCINYANITQSSTSSEVVMGAFYAYGASGMSGTIKNCINYGNVTNNSSNPNSVAGGISGNNSTCYITNCANYGTITAITAGGIFGYYGNATNCLNAGEIISINSSVGYAGGIAGYNRGDTSNGTSLIQNCVNYGSVSGGTSNGHIIGYNYVNVANKGLYKDCFYDEDISGLSPIGGENDMSIQQASSNSVYKFKNIGTSSTVSDMEGTPDLVEQLNNFADKSSTYSSWKYDKNGYPVLDL